MGAGCRRVTRASASVRSVTKTLKDLVQLIEGPIVKDQGTAGAMELDLHIEAQQVAEITLERKSIRIFLGRRASPLGRAVAALGQLLGLAHVELAAEHVQERAGRDERPHGEPR